MPKIIENVREELLRETKRQLDERGYEGTTIRSVAAATGIGIGTVYNYFKSKDMLIASFMLEDWRVALDKMRSPKDRTPRGVLFAVYDALSEFKKAHISLFSDHEAAKSFNTSHSEYHRTLRGQIASIVAPVSSKIGKNSDFTAEFIAESLIAWTMEERDFDEVYSVLESIIK